MSRFLVWLRTKIRWRIMHEELVTSLVSRKAWGYYEWWFLTTQLVNSDNSLRLGSSAWWQCQWILNLSGASLTPDSPGKASLPSPRNFLWARCTLLFLQTLAHEQNADNNSHKIKLITVFFTISQLSTLCNYPKQMTAEHLKRNNNTKKMLQARNIRVVWKGKKNIIII